METLSHHQQAGKQASQRASQLAGPKASPRARQQASPHGRGGANARYSVHEPNAEKTTTSNYFSKMLKTHFLKIPFGAIPKMVEAIHFNDKKPENKNIIIPNKNNNMVKGYVYRYEIY